MPEAAQHGSREAAILDALPMLVAACDAAGTIVAVNRAWREAAQRNGLDLPGHGVGASYLEICRRAVAQDPSVAPLLEGLEGVLEGRRDWFAAEYELPAPSGVRWFRVDVAPASELDPRGGAVLVHADVTERRALELQLRHAQKMEAMGVLAGGVAHDFNNLLQAIGGFAKLALKPVAGTQAGEDLQQVLAASERASRLVRQLQTLSRRGEEHSREPIEIVDLLRNLDKMLRRLLGPDVELALDLPEDPALVLGDPGQIEQVLMNLCLNSRDSIRGRGQVTVGVDQVDLTADDLEAWDWARPGRYVRMRVQDDGAGIEASDLAHLFEPFFTTKESSGGSGLGLSIVWGIVRQHGGTIDVSSVPGEGTTVVIQLPGTSPTTCPEPPGRGRAAADGRGRVLVAEDDPAVRRFLERILQAAGYELLVAPDGARAIQIFEADPEAIDLAVLDAVMPGANGREVFERLRASRPELPVVFLSGYSFDVLGPGFLPGADVPLVAKPFDPAQLLDVLQSVQAGTWSAVKRS